MTREVKIRKPVHVIGYGNPGRQDDGLGPMFVHALKEWRYQLTLDDPYQLTVEDATTFEPDHVVVFVDAATNLNEPYHFTALHPSTEDGLSSHRLSPRSLLQLSKTVFGKTPEAYLMAIKGIEFDDFEEKLSCEASSNLKAALAFFEGWLNEHGLSTKLQAENQHA